jgi:hypothetical protein
LCDYLEKKTGKKMTTDNMRKTYLNELFHNGVIEEYENEDPATGRPKRDKLYGPLIITREQVSNQAESRLFDNVLHEHALKVPRKYIEIPDKWLEFEITELGKYRIQNDKIRIFHMGVKEDESEEIVGKEDANAAGSQERVQISLDSFCEIYEKNDKLIRYFSMDDSCNKRINLYEHVKKSYENGENSE